MDELLGWRWAYLLAALGGVLIAAVAFLTVPEPKPLVFVGQSDCAPGCAPSAAITTDAEIPATPAATGVLSQLGWGRGLSSYSLVRGGGPAIREYGARVGTSQDDAPAVPESSLPSSRLSDNGRQENGFPAAGNDDDDHDDNCARQLTGRSRPLRSRSARVNERSPRSRSDGIEAGLQQQPPPQPPVPLSPLCRFRRKLPDLSSAWLGSPSLLLVCVAGGVRDAGGFVFGYYLASYFGPLMDGNAALTGYGGDPCLFSFDADYDGEQVTC